MARFKGLSILLAVCFTANVYSQQFRKADLEGQIREGVSNAYSASVRIWGIDSLSGKQNSAQFSGVVVTKEGHILTAAHAIKSGHHFKVIFPDGRECTGKAMGRIGFRDRENMPDLGMIRITDQGDWPVAEMGWSYSLKQGEPCISISYPETLNQPFPTVRVGRISDPATRWGFVQSTCKMEPGDSGGPLFDYMGRVVAIHSRIDVSEDVNFEVPVDLYRKYWSALNNVKDYEELPELLDSVGEDPRSSDLKTFPDMDILKKEFKLRPGMQPLVLKSRLKAEASQVLGTLFYLKSKDRSFVISKSSMVGDSVRVLLGKRELEVSSISRDRQNDLVMLQLKEVFKEGIALNALEKGAEVTTGDIGKFLISPLPEQRSEMAVLSSGLFNIPKKFSSGYFGASANFIKEQIILTRINPESPAETGGLKLKDQVTGINGVPIHLPPHYGAEIMKYEPGDTITVQGVRDSSAYSIPVVLGMMPVKNNHPASRFEGGKSLRCDGFNGVFAHDAVIKPEECGGPVFDLAGNFYGINIARFSRTCCLAIAKEQLYEFVKGVLVL